MSEGEGNDTTPSRARRSAAYEAGLVGICVKVKRDGNRCTKSALAGTPLCASHGGTARHIKEAGAARLFELQPLAIDRFREFLTPVSEDDKSKACPLCGRGMPRDPHLVANVATRVLDRTGLGPTSKLELSSNDDSAWVEYANEEESLHIFNIMMACKERMGQTPIDVESRDVTPPQLEEGSPP